MSDSPLNAPNEVIITEPCWQCDCEHYREVDQTTQACVCGHGPLDHSLQLEMR